MHKDNIIKGVIYNEAKAMENRDFNSMKELMANISETDYENMILIQCKITDMDLCLR
ncbi:hypothetical protein [Clostridium beijerinckii]|jgi:hypothetical protein|uniref:Uncharacterized protein n=1 Tax=Clostridium beijerinckii TaxID=1520 RepID=A0AAE2RUB4_CLOBE|nr:hypothetical protein [Clostridium beijerinckii]MBF7810601.1 hypothetical protein [Clostridium beijerinckii]NOW91321.1 hypothetical protein [Clostridium beijerinckii]NRT23879.1 hypothetical protein [Clostridium beijerinckii]NRT68538.1 hypothetical protein [Clostridium beijerinckii]NRT86295.1 hypothetical protein [Clostridium beijerinckii]